MAMIVAYASVAAAASDSNGESVGTNELISNNPAENEENIAVASDISTAFNTSTGGTLILEYTGDIDSLSNRIYTKVIYLPADKVVFLQHAYYSETLLDFIKTTIIGGGSTIVTQTVAQLIATHLNVTIGTVSPILGLSLRYVVWVLENLDTWDLMDAVSKSTTGKLKIEFSYVLITYPPQCVKMECFEPWDDSRVEVPKNYNYDWYENVYDGNPCETHAYSSWTSINEDVHRRQCSVCEHIDIVAHSYKWVSLNSSTHRGTCSGCGQTKTELHRDSYNEVRQLCTKCGYRGAISIPTYMMKDIVLVLD